MKLFIRMKNLMFRNIFPSFPTMATGPIESKTKTTDRAKASPTSGVY